MKLTWTLILTVPGAYEPLKAAHKLLTVHGSIFSGKFDCFVKECVPMSVPRNKKNLYINREARSLKNKKNRLWKRYTRSQFQSD